MRGLFEIFSTFLKLGLTSFGGPVAHLSYFHNEFVLRKKWLDEHSYADLVGLCQFLPGPASSQVGIAVGLSRGGILGSVFAWLGFTLPSAIILVLFGLGVSQFSNSGWKPWLHGLKIAAVAVVAQAIWLMAQRLCPDRERVAIALSALIIAFHFTNSMGQIAAILFGGLLGWMIIKKSSEFSETSILSKVNRLNGMSAIVIFVLLLLGLPILNCIDSSQGLKLFSSFFRAGSLVFGGGHVVLPLLQAEVVQPGWVSKDAFMAGYGAAQAIPGPLFTFTAYLGAVSKIPPTRFTGAVICLSAAFLPSFLLVIGILPFWDRVRHNSNLRAAMHGINAAVVGLLFSAFCNPVWTSAIFNVKDLSLAILGFILLMVWSLPTWAVVLLIGLTSGLLL